MTTVAAIGAGLRDATCGVGGGRLVTEADALEGEPAMRRTAGRLSLSDEEIGKPSGDLVRYVIGAGKRRPDVARGKTGSVHRARDVRHPDSKARRPGAAEGGGRQEPRRGRTGEAPQ